jgi:hypothetical protein
MVVKRRVCVWRKMGSVCHGGRGRKGESAAAEAQKGSSKLGDRHSLIFLDLMR